ncbi:hypothetical protein [Cohnella sp. GbtcB17]|uniref:hypothetical protein n=1 Tax=Cohnella sp. GbtcB17 TaxID=2824762 RepID=UPI0020C5F825|nr:hypothetical protein [Cohnella sp. GbtcB17]
MNNIQAVLFDLDNTLLDRTLTFHNFTTSFVYTYFAHDLLGIRDFFDFILVSEVAGVKKIGQLNI